MVTCQSLVLVTGTVSHDVQEEMLSPIKQSGEKLGDRGLWGKFCDYLVFGLLWVQWAPSGDGEIIHGFGCLPCTT